MAEETFATYHGSRPGAAVPAGVGDTLLILQGGVIKSMLLSDLVLNVPTIVINASAAPVNTLLPASGIVRYTRDDATANGHTIAPSVVGQTVMRQNSINGLSVQDEFITLQLIGTDWKRVG